VRGLIRIPISRQYVRCLHEFVVLRCVSRYISSICFSMLSCFCLREIVCRFLRCPKSFPRLDVFQNSCRYEYSGMYTLFYAKRVLDEKMLLQIVAGKSYGSKSGTGNRDCLLRSSSPAETEFRRFLVIFRKQRRALKKIKI